ncbi:MULTISPECIES: DUF4153 domain-containing protein [unclassified Leptotrichia]|uniref:DUF4153 domain-containing protein n=1 Tax=unclassified Leptotrichia TaxID=2633022 RepID=UPI0003ADB6A5|nr:MULTISPECIES: DUF4153 domain-containing protein [unclassified Leptotrichia]ERL05025.1 hypothetical protein HMPREF9108_02068 [Leptotrichia sp. oral taxon 225 str. F0581]WLD74001.1 DUF4153 domain-containing protein [Leptotrichia sp. HMT-225]
MKKIKENVKKLLLHFKSGVERFPITIILAFLHFITGIYIAEVRSFQSDEFVEVNLLLFGSIFITAMCEMLYEKYFYKQNRWLVRGIYSVITFAVSIIVFVEYLRTSDYYNIYYFTLIPISIVLFLLIPILKKKENKEKYLQSVFSNFVITGIFVAVLWIGIEIILTTVNYLFFNSGDSLFFRLTTYSFWFITEVFGASLFLSLLKKPDDNLENYEFPFIFNLLIKFVIIPLIIIYTGVLYIYMMKVLISMHLPKGLISHLVLWYTAFSVAVMILITPFTQKDKFFENFKKYFPYFSIPLIFASLFAVFQRTYQYGITENRYYVLISIFWLLFCMILYIRKMNITGIFISLIACLVISVYTPLSAKNVSNFSQSQRLKRMLVKYGALKDEKISKITQKLNNSEGSQIYTTLQYISDNSTIAKLNFKNEKGEVYSTLGDLEKGLDVKESWKDYYYRSDDEGNYEERKVVTYKVKNSENAEIISDIAGYDNFISYKNVYNEDSTNQENESEKYKIILKNKTITINSKDEAELAKINYEDVVKQIASKLRTSKLPVTSDTVYEVPQKDLEYIGTIGKINYKISLRSINEEIINGKPKDLYYEEFDFMFSEKK